MREIKAWLIRWSVVSVRSKGERSKRWLSVRSPLNYVQGPVNVSQSALSSIIHNSLSIFATPRILVIKLRNPLGFSYIKNTLKDQLFKTVCSLTTGFAGPKRSRDIREPGPCRIALSWMHAALNKRHRVSPKTSRKLDYYLWREIQTIVIISCSPYSTHRAGLNSNPILIWTINSNPNC